jgi:hypothetical protein
MSSNDAADAAAGRCKVTCVCLLVTLSHFNWAHCDQISYESTGSAQARLWWSVGILLHCCALQALPGRQ